LKRIDGQIKKNKLDLKKLQDEIVALCGKQSVTDEETPVEESEPEVLETLQSWI
jgi:hypothetical protein